MAIKTASKFFKTEASSGGLGRTVSMAPLHVDHSARQKLLSYRELEWQGTYPWQLHDGQTISRHLEHGISCDASKACLPCQTPSWTLYTLSRCIGDAMDFVGTPIPLPNLNLGALANRRLRSGRAS